jgi:hypothetical protein
MSSWDREIMFSIKLQFLFDDTKWFPSDFTLYSPIKDIIWYLGYIIWEFLCRDNLVNLWEGRFVVGPVTPEATTSSPSPFS